MNHNWSAISDSNSFAPFCADKMEIEKRTTYLTVICLIVTIQKRYNIDQAFKTRFLFIVKPFIYRMVPIFINSQSAI